MKKFPTSREKAASLDSDAVNIEEVMKNPLFADSVLTWDSMLKAALWYAGRGWPVFPCNIDKTPLTEHGFKDATKDATQIKVWWTRWPKASIAIPTGTITNLVVIDIDPRHGGDQSWAALVKKHGELPVNLTQTTGGGGKHHLHDAGGKQFPGGNGKLGTGIDIKADGGCIIIAPSGHPSGNRYRWDNYPQQIPTPLPSWLAKRILKPPKAQPKNGTEQGTKIPEGGRRTDAVSRAGAMRRKVFTADAIYQALSADNAARYEPPLAEEELRGIAYDFEKRYAPAPAEEIPGRILVTELSNAERLLAKYAADLRFAADRGVWVVWNGQIWAVDDDAGALRMVADVSRNIYFEAAAQSTQFLREALSEWARESEARHVQKNSLAMASIDLRVEVRKFSDAFDRDIELINTTSATTVLNRRRT